MGPGDSSSSLRAWAIHKGVPEGRIRTEAVSQGTHSSMLAVRPILEAEYRAVTPEQIQKTAREYLRRENRTVYTIIPGAAAAGVATAAVLFAPRASDTGNP